MPKNKDGWMDEVRVILWGPTEEIAANDHEFQEQVKLMLDAEIEVIACKACSDNYGVSDELEKIGISVQYVGTLITQMLKEDWKQLTF